MNNFVGDVKANPRDFYRYIISQKKDTQGIPPLKKRNGSGIAQSAPFMHDIVVTKEGVTKLLKGLHPSTALGPDELHPRVLKELALELGPVFAHLFQQSIDTGEIPKKMVSC